MTVTIRPIRPSDYRPVIAVIDDWWNGRRMADKLPRLFFEHFTDTCFAAERDGELVGFLVGFTSQSRPGEAYIHFVGVHPGERGRGLGRRLYEHFFAAVRARGCQLVRAITAPVNRDSMRFHGGGPVGPAQPCLVLHADRGRAGEGGPDLHRAAHRAARMAGDSGHPARH